MEKKNKNGDEKKVILNASTSEKAIRTPGVIITNGLEWFWNDQEKRLKEAA